MKLRFCVPSRNYIVDVAVDVDADVDVDAVVDVDVQ